MADSKYNGWTNYETWVVKLWMDNEQPSSEYWAETARELWDTTEDIADRSVHARILLADRLKDEHEQSKDDILSNSQMTSSVWADLLGAALGSVNWFEIADSLLTDADVVGYEEQR